MGRNYLVTGPPRCGKTTVLQRTSELLRDKSYSVGGLHSPEIREDGERVGFELVDVATGSSWTLAHAERLTPTRRFWQRYSLQQLMGSLAR